MRSLARLAALVAGGVLLALEAMDIAYVVTRHAPWTSHVGTFLLFVGAGLALLLWGSRPAPSEPAYGPALFWTVVALTVGTLLLFVGAFQAVLAALFFGGASGLSTFLIPWGIMGGILVVIGARRLAQARPGNELPPPAWAIGGERAGRVTASPRVDVATLEATRRTVIDAVRDAYRTTYPGLRLELLSFRTGGMGGLAFAVYLLLLAVGVPLFPTPFGPAPPASERLFTGLLGLLLGAIAFDWSWAAHRRLGAFASAEAEIARGRVPLPWVTDWVPVGLPFQLLASAILRPGDGREAFAPAEESVLASSFELLRFGRWLVTSARIWYTGVFLLWLLGGSLATYALIVSAGVALAPGALPLVVLLASVSVLVVMVGAFAYLYRRYRRVDAVRGRLRGLEVGEAELTRAFWSRF